jgi:serine/threonine protein kinase
MKGQNDNAAYALEGKVLKNKWTVLKIIEPGIGATGGFFSVCYLVTDGNINAFLKALNFRAFFQLFKGRPVVEIINEQTNAFKYEKELLLRCKSNRLSKISTILDEGEEYLTEYTIPNVPYLIFELADGDLRSRIEFNNNLQLAWKLRSLHNVAVGLKQLHSIDIGHQDLKPSNILLYEKGLTSKIADLGRSLCYHIKAPHENGVDFPGDFSYAPPEFLYGEQENDWNKRVKSTDMYLFGSLVCFYFTAVNITAIIGKNLDNQFRWNNWGGSFQEVRSYLVDAFYKGLNEFKKSIPNEELGKKLSYLIEICSFPHPEKRGHPRSRIQNSSQFDFQRIISQLDVLATKAELSLFKWQ